MMSLSSNTLSGPRHTLSTQEPGTIWPLCRPSRSWGWFLSRIKQSESPPLILRDRRLHGRRAAPPRHAVLVLRIPYSSLGRPIPEAIRVWISTRFLPRLAFVCPRAEHPHLTFICHHRPDIMNWDFG